MAFYLPPKVIDVKYNASNFNYQDDYLTLHDTEQRYLKYTGGTISGSLVIKGDISSNTFYGQPPSYFTGTTSNIQNQFNTLTGNITTINSNITTIKSNITTINSNIVDLSSNITKINANILIITGSITDLSSNIVNINGSISNINDEILIINGNITAIHDKFVEIEATAAATDVLNEVQFGLIKKDAITLAALVETEVAGLQLQITASDAQVGIVKDRTQFLTAELVTSLHTGTDSNGLPTLYETRTNESFMKSNLLFDNGAGNQTIGLYNEDANIFISSTSSSGRGGTKMDQSTFSVISTESNSEHSRLDWDGLHCNDQDAHPISFFTTYSALINGTFIANGNISVNDTNNKVCSFMNQNEISITDNSPGLQTKMLSLKNDASISFNTLATSSPNYDTKIFTTAGVNTTTDGNGTLHLSAANIGLSPEVNILCNDTLNIKARNINLFGTIHINPDPVLVLFSNIYDGGESMGVISQINPIWNLNPFNGL